MNTMEIVKDAIRYPFSDWKKILILGIILVLNGIYNVFGSIGTINFIVILFLTIIGFVIGFLVNGYMFRIVKSSLYGKNKLPEFGNWLNMGVDGVKVFITFIVYLIPVIIVLLLIYLNLPFENCVFNPFTFLINPFVSIIFNGLINIQMLLFNVFQFEIIIIPFIAYLFIIIPIFLVAIANMAYYDGEFKSAFRILEIIKEISLIGWRNLIKWYIMILIIVLVYMLIGGFVFYVSCLTNLDFVAILMVKLFDLVITSYFYMILARSLGLFYMPDKKDSILIEE